MDACNDAAAAGPALDLDDEDAGLGPAIDLDDEDAGPAADESEMPTQEIDFKKLHENLTDMSLVSATWNIEETKFTEVVCRDVQAFMMDITMLLSTIEALMNLPETPIDEKIMQSFGEIVDKFDTLNEIAKANQAEKRRRLTPETSLQ